MNYLCEATVCVCVCLCVWSLVTQPSGRNPKHLGITHSRPFQVSGCPGAQVAGVSCQDLFPSGSGASDTILHQCLTLISRFLVFVPVTLTCINKQLTFDMGRNMSRFVKYRLFLQINILNCAKLQTAQQRDISWLQQIWSEGWKSSITAIL